MRLARAWTAAALTATLLAGLAGCGSDQEAAVAASPSATSVSQESSPEEHHASAAEVSAGLVQLKTIVAAVAAAVGSDKATATAANESIEPFWYAVEGTVKENDPDTYLAFEDNAALLGNAVESDDNAKARTASDAIGGALDAYLARFPASGATASASPGGSASPG